MKNLRNILFILALAALGSTGLGAMKRPRDGDGAEAPVAKKQKMQDAAPQRPNEVLLGNALYASLEKLLQTKSFDVLVIILKDYFSTQSRLMLLQDIYGDTALHYAVNKNNEVIVKLLIESAGAKVCHLVSMPNQRGKTASSIAKYNNLEPIAQLLGKYS